jgi:hypothetical protein
MRQFLASSRIAAAGFRECESGRRWTREFVPSVIMELQETWILHSSDVTECCIVARSISPYLTKNFDLQTIGSSCRFYGLRKTARIDFGLNGFLRGAKIF